LFQNRRGSIQSALIRGELSSAIPHSSELSKNLDLWNKGEVGAIPTRSHADSFRITGYPLGTPASAHIRE
jgi:hypothetical protein